MYASARVINIKKKTLARNESELLKKKKWVGYFYSFRISCTTGWSLFNWWIQARAFMMVPERWWTIPAQGKARGNSGGIGFDVDRHPRRSGSRMQSYLVNALCKTTGANSKGTDFALAAWASLEVRQPRFAFDLDPGVS